MREADLQASVIECAHLFGYRVAHFHRAQPRPGAWITPVGADGKGWPDLFLARPGRSLAVELKAVGGRTSPEQDAWLELLTAAGVETYVWWPADWASGRVEAVLR